MERSSSHSNTLRLRTVSPLFNLIVSSFFFFVGMAIGSSASDEHLQLNPRPPGRGGAFFWTFASILVPLDAFFACLASALLFLLLTPQLFDLRDIMSYNSISGALAMPSRKIPHPGGAELVLRRPWKNLALEEHFIGGAHVGLRGIGKETSRHRYPELEILVRITRLALTIVIFVDGHLEARERQGLLFFLKGLLPFLLCCHCHFHCSGFFHLFSGGKEGWRFIGGAGDWKRVFRCLRHSHGVGLWAGPCMPPLQAANFFPRHPTPPHPPLKGQMWHGFWAVKVVNG
ncbi:hypothetical protein BHE74_00044043 [Ensete ventricosum]|nr:hypothetical protein BHE74_00044043 [Ensete ventricosum]